jgi:signal transduction histidine kinase
MPVQRGEVRRDEREARRAPPREPDRTLSSLEQISRVLTVTTRGVPVLLQTIVDTIAAAFDCPFVYLVVKSGDSEVCAMYPPRPDPPTNRLFPGAWCITERTLLQSGPTDVVCRAADGCPCVVPGAVITIPMSRDGVLQGSIAFHTSGDSGLDEYNSSLLQLLADQATVAIQNARLFEESQQLRRQAEDLYRVADAQRAEAERKRRELEMAQDEIDAMEREQIISGERERIARELHDDVAQILAGIGLNVEWCRQQLPPDSVVQERLSCLKELARDGLYEIRHALLGLSPGAVTQLGLVGGLGKLVEDFQRISRTSAVLEVTGTARATPRGTDDALYHICREALHNAFKHARATTVRVSLTLAEDAVSLSVVDDGVGLGAAVTGAGPGVTFGLSNMRSRAAELGGHLTIGRDGDRGTRVTARIPG